MVSDWKTFAHKGCQMAAVKKKKKFAEEKKKNAISLVLPIEEISLRPDLSSSARFRIQGGYPELDGGGGRTDGRTKEILVSNLG